MVVAAAVVEEGYLWRERVRVWWDEWIPHSMILVNYGQVMMATAALVPQSQSRQPAAGMKKSQQNTTKAASGIFL